MKISFSRKGFDSGSGGKPSPIVDGRPISLPIPATCNSRSTYRDLGLGSLVETTTGGKILGDALCHADPWFAEGRCAFGQTGAAQGHLRNQGFGAGDLFLFFGLFTDEHDGERHHRIFGYLQVEDVIPLGATPDPTASPAFARDHPHFIGQRDRNNTLYVGPGRTSETASPTLRLTHPEGPPSLWVLPNWVHRLGLSYHAKPERWLSSTVLQSAAKGQEFVCDVRDDSEAHEWVSNILFEIDKPHEKRRDRSFCSAAA